MCSSDEDHFIPKGVCLAARVPTKAIYTLVRVTVFNIINTVSSKHDSSYSQDSMMFVFHDDLHSAFVKQRL